VTCAGIGPQRVSHGAARARGEPAVAAAEAEGTQQVVEPKAKGTPADARGICYVPLSPPPPPQRTAFRVLCGLGCPTSRTSTAIRRRVSNPGRYVWALWSRGTEASTELKARKRPCQVAAPTQTPQATFVPSGAVVAGRFGPNRQAFRGRQLYWCLNGCWKPLRVSPLTTIGDDRVDDRAAEPFSTRFTLK